MTVWLWVVVLLLSLQLGPVYSIRIRMTTLAVDLTDDIFVGCWFFVLYTIGAVLVRGSGVVRRMGWSAMAGAAAFCAALGMSTLWSVDVARTFSQVVLTAGTVVAASVAGSRLLRAEFCWALFVSSHIGALFAFHAVSARWPESRDELGHWTGIYFNRNSLGPVAVVGLMTMLYLAPSVMRRMRAQRPDRVTGAALAVAFAGAAYVDVRLVRGSGSATGVVAGAAALTAAAMAFGLRACSRRPRSVPAALAAILAASGFASVELLRHAVPKIFGRGNDLDRRTEIWHVVTWGIHVHPVRGWGWVAAWRDPVFMERVIGQLGQPIGSAHSGYLEVVLGLGLVGLIPLAIMLVALTRRVLRAVVAGGELATLPLALFVYFAVMNLGETFIGANLLPFALAIAAAPLAHPEAG